MKTSKKIIILSMLTFFIIMITPLFSNAADLMAEEENRKLARRPTDYMFEQGYNYFQNAAGSSTDPIANPNAYKPGSTSAEDINVITSKANPIIGAIVTVGVVVSAITMCILGIKYMVGSVEERAEYKKSMIPYLVGAVLLFAGSVVVSIIANLVMNIKI